MDKLKPCPFCGSAAVISRAEYQFRYAERKQEIPKGSRIIRSMKYPSGKTYYEYRQQAFVPQCAMTACLGRTRKLFDTEAEAIEAWNQRTPVPCVR